MYDLRNESVLFNLTGHNDIISSLAISLDGTSLISNSLILFNFSNDIYINNYLYIINLILIIFYNYFSMLGMDNTLCLWDIKPFCLGSRCKRIYKGHTVYFFFLLLLLRILIFNF